MSKALAYCYHVYCQCSWRQEHYISCLSPGFIATNIVPEEYKSSTKPVEDGTVAVIYSLFETTMDNTGWFLWIWYQAKSTAFLSQSRRARIWWQVALVEIMVTFLCESDEWCKSSMLWWQLKDSSFILVPRHFCDGFHLQLLYLLFLLMLLLYAPNKPYFYTQTLLLLLFCLLSKTNPSSQRQ
jgi:hypothetical protein